MLSMKYVCGFRGRRDGYEIPLALAEKGLLDHFVTDHYLGNLERAFSSVLPRRISDTIRSRYKPGVPGHCVRTLRVTAVQETIAKLLGWPAAEIYERFDASYGKKAAAIAHRNRSNLFMYSPYAWAAFSANFKHEPRKILFQYHPHHFVENEILRKDASGDDELGIVFDEHLENLYKEGRVSRLNGDSAWQLADHVVCASSFTRRSLIDAGALPDQISVIPYGVEIDTQNSFEQNPASNEVFHAIFVGSGIRRKGVHHLLEAWKCAELPLNSRLTLVMRVMDAGLAPLVASAQDVDVRRGVDSEELRRLYANATVLVMPSLVEGFGQVYLEALAAGLPVLGTGNTCCPDLGNESDGVYLTNPGDKDDLIAKLEMLATRLPGNMSIRSRARACAQRYTWDAFRKKIQDVLERQAPVAG